MSSKHKQTPAHQMDKRGHARRRKNEVPVMDCRATKLPRGVVPVEDTVQDMRYDEVRNVRWNLRVIRNVRRDPIGAMQARGQLDECQVQGARSWQAEYEASQIGGIKAMNPMKEPVDGNPPQREPITDRQQSAMKSLRRVDDILGVRGAIVTRLVLAQCFSIGQVAEHFGDDSKIMRDRLGWLLRDCLNELAKYYGWADRRLASVEAPR